MGIVKKSVIKYFYTLASSPVKTSRASEQKTKRLKNWGYMIKQNKGKSIDFFGQCKRST